MRIGRDKTPAVVLISPGIIKWTDVDFGLPHLVSMGGYLQRHLDVRVEILDLSYEGGDHRDLLRTLESLSPIMLVGVSAFSSFDYLRSLSLGRFLKDHLPDVPLITGGYHVSALPDDLVYEGSPFDAAVIGEGERPLVTIVQELLGGGGLSKDRYGPDNIEDLDELPPYKWELLDRYWPKAKKLGGKLQVYLARGCPYHCTFCMERAKTEYKWRAYSAPRAIEELERLSRFTDLGHWIVNVADPLFGFRRSWRREVLQGIIEKELFPKQYWTLTRSDDLDDEDVKLLAEARFSIGIGAETGSPTMVGIMQKAARPERYLGALERLAGLSKKHGLNWAANIIVGHPGETEATMRETRDFVTRLFASGGETCGWLSFDPFRVYPGALVHEEMARWERETGARFFHKDWWKSWYDAPFKAQHLDPSHSLDFAGRVRFMHETYAPLAEQIQARFRGQGRAVDRVFERSLAEQRALLSEDAMKRTLAQGERARAALDAAPGKPLAISGQPQKPVTLAVPIGLRVKDPQVRARENVVRRLLERGVLKTEALVRALVEVDPADHLSGDEVDALLAGRPAPLAAEGDVPAWLPLDVVAVMLEALAPGLTDRVADLTGRSRYVSALLSMLVGDEGEVVRLRPGRFTDPTVGKGVTGPFDRLFVGGALPRIPDALVRLLRAPEGQAVLFVGPRFRPQDLVVVTADKTERTVGRASVPVLAGKAGWIRA